MPIPILGTERAMLPLCIAKRARPSRTWQRATSVRGDVVPAIGRQGHRMAVGAPARAGMMAETADHRREPVRTLESIRLSSYYRHLT